MQHLYKKIYADPRFTELVNKKKRFSWLLSIIVMAIYFTFILVIAFAPELFGKPLSESSVITVGYTRRLICHYFQFFADRFLYLAS